MIQAERFSNLPDYAFPRLRALLAGLEPGGPEIPMSIGEPKHPMPPFLERVLSDAVAGFAKYPKNEGTEDLLDAITGFLARRYGITLGAENVMALNGTREGLFNAVLALCPAQKNGAPAKVLMPNPFYQVYTVGTAAVGAEPHYVSATRDTGFLPDFASLSTDVLDATAVAFICSPSNPQGAIADKAYLTTLLQLAEKHDFYVFADECYSEIYDGPPPPGILEVASGIGVDLNRVLAFHSLSKRSNMPGLRSGFVAGGAPSIAAIRQLRNYAGAPLPEPLQAVAAAAWRDDEHVIENRAMYVEKYKLAAEVFADQPEVTIPRAGFFLWLPVDDGEAAVTKLWQETGIKALPGAYLSRPDGATDPGRGYIRVAMVTDLQTLKRGLIALKASLYEGGMHDLRA